MITKLLVVAVMAEVAYLIGCVVFGLLLSGIQEKYSYEITDDEITELMDLKTVMIFRILGLLTVIVLMWTFGFI